MSAFVTDGPTDETSPPQGNADRVSPASELPLTGERTIPGLDIENYWFRRHEVVYRRLSGRCTGRDVLEAGFGEGYGADLLAGVARRVTGVDYDESAVAVDVVVNFQVIEHLWDQSQFVAECRRVLRPGGLLLISTPNRITFTPGSDTPVNPFHTRELNAAELTELLVDGGFALEGVYGVFHGPHLRELDARHGGSIIDAQIARALADAPWPADLLADVAGVRTEDFELVPDAERDIDDSLDLVAIAVRP